MNIDKLHGSGCKIKPKPIQIHHITINLTSTQPQSNLVKVVVVTAVVVMVEVTGVGGAVEEGLTFTHPSLAMAQSLTALSLPAILLGTLTTTQIILKLLTEELT